MNGTQEYAKSVLSCLEIVRRTQDGLLLLDKINATGFKVTIENTEGGNQMKATVGADAVPKMCRAIQEKNSTSFSTELKLSLQRAAHAGITVDHYARQLANGLTPASYTGLDNSARPTSKIQAVKASIFGGTTQAGRDAKAAQQTINKANKETEKIKGWLEGFADGEYNVVHLPPGWDYEIPRLLRLYLTPGPGTESTVLFNPTKTFHCKGDPAMHKRPPAIGLAHEMIHALHAAQGVHLGLVVRNGHRLEEVVTTGMAPYQYEEISDNKMRTQWPTEISLRKNYTLLAGTTSAQFGPPT